jgi:hemerythrin-like domain-containing protein
MKPIGPLMIEHRLIERAIGLLKAAANRMRTPRTVDIAFPDDLLDFFRTYADMIHHGKEEEILFRELARKEISEEHRGIMNGLIAEHAYARSAIGGIGRDNVRLRAGDSDALGHMLAQIDELLEMYPRHIETEDKHFFFPVLAYFSRDEQDSMLDEFWEFDKRMIHEKYRRLIEALEAGAG